VAAVTFTGTIPWLGESLAEVAVILALQGGKTGQAGIPFTLTWRLAFPTPAAGDTVISVGTP
jgi:hypothetical protein